jgi:hypothetical protein
MAFVKGDNKPNDIETFKLPCEEINSFPIKPPAPVIPTLINSVPFTFIYFSK